MTFYTDSLHPDVEAVDVPGLTDHFGIGDAIALVQEVIDDGLPASEAPFDVVAGKNLYVRYAHKAVAIFTVDSYLRHLRTLSIGNNQQIVLARARSRV